MKKKLPPIEPPSDEEQRSEAVEMREKFACISVKEAAERAGRAQQTIYAAMKRGDVAGMERAGRTYVNLVSLDEWIGPRPIQPRVAARRARAARNR